MATFDFRILLETVEGVKTSYMSQSFVDTSVDLVLSSSQAYNRITGSVSASYQNQLQFSGSNLNTSKTFKNNLLLSASLQNGVITGSIDFTATTSEYDRLLRYKFFGEKVCNVLGLPHAQWVYVDQFSLNADSDNNFFEGNVNSQNLFVGDSMTFANDSTVNSDIPFLINTGSDRHIKFIDERDFGTRALIIGYDKDNDTYEVSGSQDNNFNIGGVDKIVFADGTAQTSAGGGGAGNVAGLDTTVQFNDGGAFGGDAGFTYNKTTDSVTIAGNLIVAGEVQATSITSSRITASVVYASGSNTFGDTIADTHTFIGNITASGNISASGNVIASLGTGSFANIIVGQLDALSVPKGNLRVKSDSTHRAIMIEENSSNETYVLGVNASGDFNIFNSGDTTPNFVITDGDNVGIGTEAPTVPLQILLMMQVKVQV